MIKICGNCEYYTYGSNPSTNGGCTKKGFKDYHYFNFSPLTDCCQQFKEKKR